MSNQPNRLPSPPKTDIKQGLALHNLVEPFDPADFGFAVDEADLRYQFSSKHMGSKAVAFVQYLAPLRQLVRHVAQAVLVFKINVLWAAAT